MKWAVILVFVILPTICVAEIRPLTPAEEFDYWQQSSHIPKSMNKEDEKLSLALFDLLLKLQTTERRRIINQEKAVRGGILTQLGCIPNLGEETKAIGLTRQANHATLWLYIVLDSESASAPIPESYQSFGIWVVQWQNRSGVYQVLDSKLSFSVRVDNYPKSEGGPKKARELNKEIQVLANKLCLLKL